ncbi:MAG: NAD-dependent deacylase [Gemmatimonadota bacterium]|nr:NAD-dependent deacylase [Gemmatimonadota bacterium]
MTRSGGPDGRDEDGGIEGPGIDGRDIDGHDEDGGIEGLDEARRRLAGSRSVAVLTGAGVSAESGVPTFRGPGGFWRGRAPEDLATPAAFARDPVAVWEFYRWRIASLRGVTPNPAHHALAALERRVPDFLLVTQNVDGLHQAAGSRRVLELHGTLRAVRCVRCRVEREAEEALHGLAAAELPSCPDCGGLLRPAVVWFGEALPDGALAAAERAARAADLLLVAGTSALVQPAASLAWTAKAAGAAVIEVNPDETPVTEIADVSLRGPAGRILPRLR